MLKTIQRYLNRLIWKTPTKRFTFFLQIGIIYTIMFGLAFTVFAGTKIVADLQLFEFTSEYLPTMPGNLWGAMLLLVVVGHVCEMMWRGKGIGSITAMVGFMLWFYAMMVYISIGAYASILLVCFWPLCYWVWYYASAITYKKQLDKGLIRPVK
jgi:hypothetical protein